jgi:hypothetical protein
MGLGSVRRSAEAGGAQWYSGAYGEEMVWVFVPDLLHQCLLPVVARLVVAGPVAPCLRVDARPALDPFELRNKQQPAAQNRLSLVVGPS